MLRWVNIVISNICVWLCLDTNNRKLICTPANNLQSHKQIFIQKKLLTLRDGFKTCNGIFVEYRINKEKKDNCSNKTDVLIKRLSFNKLTHYKY